ncbi:MAG: hypothetical protein A3B06_03895 [Candidatus Yonathbacteria bacterium RIFCSPLOWO2_01_FULL_43_20]|nr:MAG: hypothetical protein A3B06_03895 [Candidatus Yonathbacteria bacterium RIFCSPLOWO2_01_FULL_43_20]
MIGRIFSGTLIAFFRNILQSRNISALDERFPLKSSEVPELSTKLPLRRLIRKKWRALRRAKNATGGRSGWADNLKRCYPKGYPGSKRYRKLPMKIPAVAFSFFLSIRF